MLILMVATASVGSRVWYEDKCALREAEGVVMCLSSVGQYGMVGLVRYSGTPCSLEGESLVGRQCNGQIQETQQNPKMKSFPGIIEILPCSTVHCFLFLRMGDKVCFISPKYVILSDGVKRAK